MSESLPLGLFSEKGWGGGQSLGHLLGEGRDGGVEGGGRLPEILLQGAGVSTEVGEGVVGPRWDQGAGAVM